MLARMLIVMARIWQQAVQCDRIVAYARHAKAGRFGCQPFARMGRLT